MKKTFYLIFTIIVTIALCVVFCGCMDKETRAAADAFDAEAERVTQQLDELDQLIADSESDLAAGKQAEPKFEEELQKAIDKAKEAEAEITVPERPDEIEAIKAETATLKEFTLKENISELKDTRDRLHYSWEEFSLGKYDGSLGSAGKITDDTVIVSVYANDRETEWTDSSDDVKLKEDSLSWLSDAAAYLQKEVGRYAKAPKIYYDWSKDDSLVYTTDLDANFASRIDYYDVVKAYIRENVDSVALKKKYKAENILYFIFLNTDYESNTLVPTTRCWNNLISLFGEREAFAPEVIYFTFKFTVGDDRRDSDAYDVAHEIMHTFGAEDLYTTGNKIPSDYVDYCKENEVPDIMRKTNNWYPFTDVDAYYLGLTDHCDEVDEYGLGTSEHLED